MSPSDVKNPVLLRVHETSIPHFDFIEKAILDALIGLGKAEIIAETV